jgi:hypothetical protein
LLIVIALNLTITSAWPVNAQPSNAIRRLAPSAFTNLPAPVRARLQQRGCTVPQWWGNATPHNVVAGAFTAAGKSEWAVLCSVRDTAQILILDAASGMPVDSLERSADTGWVQSIGDGKWGYSRYLTLRSRARIARIRVDADGKPIPQPMDHDAINQAFAEKAATALYLSGGRLYRWATAD